MRMLAVFCCTLAVVMAAEVCPPSNTAFGRLFWHPPLFGTAVLLKGHIDHGVLFIFSFLPSSFFSSCIAETFLRLWHLCREASNGTNISGRLMGPTMLQTVLYYIVY